MGIEDFSDLLRRQAPNCCYELPLESFRGKRLAIDMHNLIYQMTSVSTTEYLYSYRGVKEVDQSAIERTALDRVLNRLEVFMYYGATPVCVFDGKSHPLKNRPGSKRRKNREALRQKMETASQRLFTTDPLLRTQAILDEFKKYRKQAVEVTPGFVSQVKDVLTNSGFTVILAESFKLETNDAEGICATLCLPGNEYCYAGVTEDSDFHVYGGNVQILEVYQKKVEEATVYFAKVRWLERILTETKLNFLQFRDLCIMLGTDFNDRIPGIGVVNCWKRIGTYGSVTGWAQADPSVLTSLNYENVMKIFHSTITRIEITPPEFNITLFKERSREVFDLYGLTDHTKVILDLIPGLSVGDRDESSASVLLAGSDRNESSPSVLLAGSDRDESSPSVLAALKL